jgi:hypothetical protein
MRSFIAFLLGIAVTVGAALVHDTIYSAPSDSAYVNWDTVQDSLRRGYEMAREQVSRLTK